ncbi:MAG: hypothetical protein AAGH70_09830 [Pseudomonadota bacterium]
MFETDNQSFTPGREHPKAAATKEDQNRSFLASTRIHMHIGVGIVMIGFVLLLVPAIGLSTGLIVSMAGFLRSLLVSLGLSAVVGYLLHRQNKAHIAALEAEQRAQHEDASAARQRAIEAAGARGDFDRWTG